MINGINDHMNIEEGTIEILKAKKENREKILNKIVDDIIQGINDSLLPKLDKIKK